MGKKKVIKKKLNLSKNTLRGLAGGTPAARRTERLCGDDGSPPPLSSRETYCPPHSCAILC